MRVLALAAAASMSLAPTLTMAQQQEVCPPNASLENGICVCASGYTLGAGGACVSSAAPDTVVAVQTRPAADLPVLGNIPPEAVVLGGLVLLGGVIIGIAAAHDDDDAAGTTTTTTN